MTPSRNRAFLDMYIWENRISEIEVTSGQPTVYISGVYRSRFVFSQLCEMDSRKERAALRSLVSFKRAITFMTTRKHEPRINLGFLTFPVFKLIFQRISVQHKDKKAMICAITWLNLRVKHFNNPRRQMRRHGLPNSDWWTRRTLRTRNSTDTK